jgi:YHS domain-containing protein
MLKYLLISVFCTLLFLNCSGEQQKEESSDVQVTTDQEVMANMAECAGGCGMAMEKEKMIAVEEDGETKYFCSEKCQEKYMAKEAEEDAEGEDTGTENES